MLFKEKLKRAMNDLNISQSQLTKITGICRSSISQYLSGKNVPNAERQIEIATALGLEPDYFKREPEPLEKVSPISGKGKIERMTVDEVADIMGTSPGVIRNGLQDGIFPWGYAVRGRGDKYVYIINAKRFASVEGVCI